jgi:hypothetical protein
MNQCPFFSQFGSSIPYIPFFLSPFTVQTVFGRHSYFRHFAVKMFSRFGIPAELMDKNFHQTAKNFRKY